MFYETSPDQIKGCGSFRIVTCLTDALGSGLRRACRAAAFLQGEQAVADPPGPRGDHGRRPRSAQGGYR